MIFEPARLPGAMAKCRFCGNPVPRNRNSKVCDVCFPFVYGPKQWTVPSQEHQNIPKVRISSSGFIESWEK